MWSEVLREALLVPFLEFGCQWAWFDSMLLVDGRDGPRCDNAPVIACNDREGSVVRVVLSVTMVGVETSSGYGM